MLSKLARCQPRSLFGRYSAGYRQLRRLNSQAEPLRTQRLLKPLVFTITICGTTFTAATIFQYEKGAISRAISNNELVKSARSVVSRDTLLQQASGYWNSQSDGFKVFTSMLVLNAIVFGCWRIPKLQPFMTRYFTLAVESKSIRCLPMLLSNFSHVSPIHFGVNMIVLFSFSQIGVSLFGIENFLALYMSSGVASAFASSLHKILTRSASLSLGASGSILGLVAAICVERPDIHLMLLFLPFFSFSSGAALKGLILFDTLGLLFSWALFDHAAHLGGAFFGIYYAKELKHFLRQYERRIIKNWVELKRKLQGK